MIPDIRIEDYNYMLSDERIAKYPLPDRDSSRLLYYSSGKIEERIFRDLPDLLPTDSIIVFNDTKVVPARLHFQRASGAHIEIFCLEPIDPPEYNTIFAVDSACRWRCVIGNSKRWKDDVLTLYNPESSELVNELSLEARLIEKEGETGIVEFRWKNSYGKRINVSHCTIQCPGKFCVFMVLWFVIGKFQYSSYSVKIISAG